MVTDARLVPLLTEADASLAKQDWPHATALLEQLVERDPDWAGAHCVPMLLAQCRIEMAPPDAVAALAVPPGAPGGSAREALLVQQLRIRAIALCRAGDHVRASRLLRMLADYDGAIADALASIIPPSGQGAAAQPVASGPSFPNDPTLSPDAVARMKQRFADARILIVYRQLFLNHPERVCDPVNNLEKSARQFGLTPRVINSHYPPPGVEPEHFVSWLQEQILAFKPHVLIYDDLFETGISAWNEALATQIGTVLQGAREILGVRVVKSLLDAWYVMQSGADRPLRGLGTSVDLLHHFHPTLHDEQSALERARSFCYPVPFDLPRPTVPWGSVPRACFAGSIAWVSIARVAWWAEIGKRALPFDFLESDHQAAVVRSDQAYANIFHQYQLSVNITRRPNGMKILTGRSIDVPFAEGVLLEEDSACSAYFLAPGVHYEPFSTLDGLQGLIDDLLRSEARRRSLAREGHRWVIEYFTGDRFWAGLLARLFT